MSRAEDNARALVGCVTLLFWIGFWGTVACVACHFITKWW